MKNAGFIALVLASAATVGAGAAMAKQGPGRHGPEQTFEQLDTDGSGDVTKAEMEAAKAARFASADSNGDGKLSLEEIAAQGQKRAQDRAARMLERFDADGDGALSQEELPKPRRSGHMFERMDADGSGGISKEEFEEARKHARMHGKHKRGPGGGMMETEQN